MIEVLQEGSAGHGTAPAYPTVSVGICSNRPGEMYLAVASVLAITTTPFELIVVAQGGDPEWAHRELAPFRDDPRLRIVHDSGRGLSRARNIMLKESTGEVVIFTDDDCSVVETWIEAHAANYRDRAEVMMMFGKVDPPDSYIGPEGTVPTFSPDDARGSPRLRGRIVLGMGANMSIRRALTGRIGLFDEQLGPGSPLQSADDFDMALRASAADMLVIADSRAEVIHVGGVRARGEASRTLWHRDGLSLGALIGKQLRMQHWEGALALSEYLGTIALDTIWRVVRGQRPFGLVMSAMLLRGAVCGLARGLWLPLVGRGARAIFQPAAARTGLPASH